MITEMINPTTTILQAITDIGIFIAVLVYSRKQDGFNRKFFEFVGAVLLMSMLWEFLKLAIGVDLFQTNLLVALLTFPALLAPGLMIKDLVIAFLSTKPNISNLAYQVMVIMTLTAAVSLFATTITRSIRESQVLFAVAFFMSLFVAWAYGQSLKQRGYRSNFRRYRKL